MRRTTTADALAAFDRLGDLRHARAESVIHAVEVALAALGARRVRAAVSGDPAAVADRRIIGYLAGVESAAYDLARIPHRGSTASARAEQWTTCLTLADQARRALYAEVLRARVTGPSRPSTPPPVR